MCPMKSGVIKETHNYITLGCQFFSEIQIPLPLRSDYLTRITYNVLHKSIIVSKYIFLNHFEFENILGWANP